MLPNYKYGRSPIIFFWFLSKKPKKCLMEMALAPSFFQVMGILKPITVSTDKGLQLSHSPMVGCNSLYGSNFDYHRTYFALWHPWTKLSF